jgi:aminoglycoside phosphotransferase family enzyme/predicted kinase
VTTTPATPSPATASSSAADASPLAGSAASLVETHTSILVFLGDRVYKLKKSADLGFLDFRTRKARKEACEAEVILNLVVMRRMPDDRRLATLVRQGAAVDAELRALARLLAGFHAACATSDEIAHAGSPEVLRGLWQEGVDALRAMPECPVDLDTVAEIEQLATRYLAGREPLTRERQHAGLIRDGHGDLLTDDVFCLDDGPRVLDCLEFDQRLRVGDVLGDVAFLAMDLERIGAPALARVFLDAYQEFSGETHPPSLEHLYVAYRAFVRCKIACVRSAQGDPHAAEESRRLARMTLDHLRQTRVRLVLVGGLPGTGKSTLAEALVADRDWTLLRSDVIRKELAGLRPGQSAAAPVNAGLYETATRERTYAELLRRARSALERGITVVLDASWTSRPHRTAAANLARDTAAELVELRCTAPRDIALERTARRARNGGNASDAGPEVYHHMAATADPWPTANDIPTDGPPDAAIRAATHAL